MDFFIAIESLGVCNVEFCLLCAIKLAHFRNGGAPIRRLASSLVFIKAINPGEVFVFYDIKHETLLIGYVYSRRA